MQKTVLVTGATSGFGRACALRFAMEGNRIVALGRREERLEALREEIGADLLHPVQLDVRDKSSVSKFLHDLPEDFRTIHVLVNNAGLALGTQPAQECTLQDWETMVDTNIKGVLYLTHAVLPAMVEHNRGHIINIGSVAGDYPYPGANVYGATKAFLKQFSLNLKSDLVGTRVRVTNIEPGIADTEFSTVRFKGDQAQARKVYERCEPLQAEDIAEAVFWAASLPEHVNINRLEIMPVCQGCAGWSIHREQD